MFKVQRYKTLGDKPGAKYEEVVVQSGLRGVFKRRCHFKSFKALIDHDVKVVSELLMTLSLYFKFKCEFMCSEEGIKEDPAFFDSFTKNSMRTVYKEVRNGGGLHGFRSLRRRCKMSKKTDIKCRSLLIDSMLLQYATSVSTNITTHIRKHLINFYSRVHEVRKLKTIKENTVFVDEMMRKPGKQDDFNADFRSNNPFSLLPVMMKLSHAMEKHQKEMEEKDESLSGLRIFKSIPLYSPVPKSMFYDSAAFNELKNRFTDVSNKKFNQKQKKPKVDRNEARKLFGEFINFQQFERPKFVGDPALLDKKFALSFSTDGKKCSLHYRRVVSEKPAFLDDDLEVESAADPGVRDWLGWISKDLTTKKLRTVKITSASFYHKSKFLLRKEQRMKLVKNAEDKLRKCREATGNISHADANVQEFTSIKLKEQKSRQTVYNSNKMLSINWRKQVESRKAVDQTSEMLVGTKKQNVYYGAGVGGRFGFPGVKGHKSAPNKKLFDSLSRHQNCRVLLTNEFRTSQICNICFRKLFTPKSPHRYQTCKNCKKVFQRDKNAAMNI